MGFLKVKEDVKESSTPNIYKIDGVKGKNLKKYVVIIFINFNLKDEIETGLTKNVCWICDRWYE